MCLAALQVYNCQHMPILSYTVLRKSQQVHCICIVLLSAHGKPVHQKYETQQSYVCKRLIQLSIDAVISRAVLQMVFDSLGMLIMSLVGLMAGVELLRQG